jgi:hypothetical protein
MNQEERDRVATDVARMTKFDRLQQRIGILEGVRDDIINSKRCAISTYQYGGLDLGEEHQEQIVATFEVEIDRVKAEMAAI